MIDYTLATILCPGGPEVLLYLVGNALLAAAPIAIGVGFIAALVKLVKEGSKNKP
jgi:hypothetical protein